MIRTFRVGPAALAAETRALYGKARLSIVPGSSNGQDPWFPDGFRPALEPDVGQAEEAHNCEEEPIIELPGFLVLHAYFSFVDRGCRQFHYNRPFDPYWITRAFVIHPWMDPPEEGLTQANVAEGIGAMVRFQIGSARCWEDGCWLNDGRSFQVYRRAECVVVDSGNSDIGHHRLFVPQCDVELKRQEDTHFTQ